MQCLPTAPDRFLDHQLGPKLAEVSSFKNQKAQLLLMSSSEYPLGASRVLAGRYPPPGTDSNADAIRERRGASGITPLDANLLHVPPVAGGFNALLGAIRNKGNLPGDIREAMVSEHELSIMPAITKHHPLPDPQSSCNQSRII